MTAALVAVVGALAALAAAAWRRFHRRALVPRAVLSDLRDDTRIDSRGAVRSVQAATVSVPIDELAELWTPASLERVARTYWRFLTRVTLGLIRVKYTDTQRTVVLLFRPFRLLRFQAPEYQMDERRGIVRWRIEDGILVAGAGRDGDGYLQIDVERTGPSPGRPGEEALDVEVEVSNFYPSLASGLSRWLYTNTQSAIHVFVTYGFLRSLARLDLAKSRVGRFAEISEVPDPPPAGESAPAGVGRLESSTRSGPR